MNLYEWEGKNLFAKHGIKIPKGAQIKRDFNNDNIIKIYTDLSVEDFVLKVQVLSGKRGKNKGIILNSTKESIADDVKSLFDLQIRGQFVESVRIEEKLNIKKEHYLSITYDSKIKQPVLVYSTDGGIDVEDNNLEFIKIPLDIRFKNVVGIEKIEDENVRDVALRLWECFLTEDARVVEINPLVQTIDDKFIAADAKVALDDDAIFRHEEWKTYEPRTMLGRKPTKREMLASSIDEGQDYYRGTAGKYIEMEGDIAVLFSGGGASIANMDALASNGLKAANYTEYSGNPPREKVYELTKVVLSKPDLKGLWISGGVANFTSVKETFQGIVDALNEIKPTYPIVVRRAGPEEDEGMDLMRACAKDNNLNIALFGKDYSMSETVKKLADMINT